MDRSLEHISDAAGFHDRAILHHADPVGVTTHDLQVVGDQQQRHPVLGPQPGQQLQDLRLDRDIECSGRFVGNQQRGIIGKRHRDHHTLSLAARELVRECLQTVFRIGKTGFAQHIHNTLSQTVRRDAPVQRNGLGNLSADAMQRVQAVHRLLEHHAGEHAARAMQRGGIARR